MGYHRHAQPAYVSGTQPACQRTQVACGFQMIQVAWSIYNHSLRVGRVRSQTVAKLVSEHCRGEHLHLMQMWEKEQNLEGKHKSFCGHMLPFLSEIYE
jgi:hypothetical protein